MGTIKFWRGWKGFGAVASDGTAPWDIWCHFTVLEVTGALPRDHQRGGWTHYVADPLKAGQHVEVEYSREDHGTFKYVARLLRRPFRSNACRLARA